MTTETYTPDLIGLANLPAARFELVEESNTICCMALKSFSVPVYNLESGAISFFEISFEEFAYRHPDHDRGYITCIQLDKDGEPDEKQLPVWDFAREVYHSTCEPYFTPDQVNNYRKDCDEVLLNCIESRY